LEQDIVGDPQVFCLTGIAVDFCSVGDVKCLVVHAAGTFLAYGQVATYVFDEFNATNRVTVIAVECI